jgi:hypothetical protein
VTNLRWHCKTAHFYSSTRQKLLAQTCANNLVSIELKYVESGEKTNARADGAWQIDATKRDANEIAGGVAEKPGAIRADASPVTQVPIDGQNGAVFDGDVRVAERSQQSHQRWLHRRIIAGGLHGYGVLLSRA